MKSLHCLIALAAVALAACQASPNSPSVSGESHFLSACAASAECVTGLECLCGVCTVACADDETCATAEAGAVCREAELCEGGGRTCTWSCAGGDCTDAGPPDADPPGVCQARDLGLTLDPEPLENWNRHIESIDVAADRLVIHVIENGDHSRTYTLTGPFEGLTPDALEGLDQFVATRHFDSPGEFIVMLTGCDRPGLWVVNASRALLERRFGPVDDFFDTGLLCDPTLPEDTCPRPYALRVDGLSIMPGDTASTLTTRYIVGRVEGCAGDAEAPARLEYVGLPRSGIPTCAGAGEPGTNDPAFTLTDENGQRFRPGEGETLDETFEVEAAPDPDDATHLVLVPTTPTPTLGTLNLRAPAGVPAGLVPPVTLHVFMDVPWHENRVVELSDATGLRFAGASSDGSGPSRFSALRVTRQPPICLLPWDVGTIGFTPLTLQRVGDPRTVEVRQLGTTAPTVAGARVDVRAAGDYLNVCATDTPNGWLDFAATWE